MKIAFFEVKESFEKKLIKKSFPDDEVILFPKTIGESNLSQVLDAQVISTFIYSNCDLKILSKFKKLKMIETRSTGVNHIDMNFCNKNKILVYNVPLYGENTVAEFTFGLLLMISRKLIESVNRVKSGSFDFSNLRGFELAGKTVGVVGFGNIGQKFAKMCKGFEMEVIVFDVFEKQLKEKGEKIGVKFVSLDELIKKSEIISLHIPLNPKTKHIFDKKAFLKMKKGVIILNSSRGDLIKSSDLLWALEEKIVGAVGLDVLEGEKLIRDEIGFLDRKESIKDIENLKVLLQDHILINHEHVYITPHNAFNSKDALIRILNTSIENIVNFKRGNDKNRV